MGRNTISDTDYTSSRIRQALADGDPGAFAKAVQAAAAAIADVKWRVADGDAAANASLPALQQQADKAVADLNAAVWDILGSKPASDFKKEAGKIVAGADPALRNIVEASVAQVEGAEIDRGFDAPQSLKDIDHAIALTPENTDAILHNASQIIDGAAAEAAVPLTEKTSWQAFSPQERAKKALDRLQKELAGVKSDRLAGLVASAAAERFKNFSDNSQNWLNGRSIFDAGSMATLGGVLARHVDTQRAHTPEGTAAISAFSGIASNASDVSNLTAERLDLQRKIDAIVPGYVLNLKRATWLDEKIGRHLPQKNRDAANEAFKNSASWKVPNDKFQQQFAENGKKLIGYVASLGKMSLKDSFSGAAAEQFKAIVNDPAASYAMQEALTRHPELANDDFVSMFKPAFSTYGRTVWLANRLTNVVAASWMGNLANRAPANLTGAAKAQWIVNALESNKSIAGIPSEGISVLKRFVDEATKAAERGDAEGVTKASNSFSQKVNATKALAPNTWAGAAVRVAGLLNGIYMAGNTWDTAIKTGDPLTYAIAIDLSALLGVGADNASLSLSLLLGADQASIIFGKIAGAKVPLNKIPLISRVVKGPVPIVGVIIAVWGLLTAVDASRLGVKGDAIGATLQGASAIGFGAAVAPDFGAAAWTGPAGMALAFAATMAQAFYAGHKTAHAHEGDLSAYLSAADGSDVAVANLRAQAKAEGVSDAVIANVAKVWEQTKADAAFANLAIHPGIKAALMPFWEQAKTAGLGDDAIATFCRQARAFGLSDTAISTFKNQLKSTRLSDAAIAKFCDQAKAAKVSDKAIAKFREHMNSTRLSDAAITVFSKQAGIGYPNIEGQAMWPWLSRYWELKHGDKDPEKGKQETIAYLNSLSPKELEGLWNALQLAASGSRGEPSKFTTETRDKDPNWHYLDFSRLRDFESYLKDHDIPLLR